MATAIKRNADSSNDPTPTKRGNLATTNDNGGWGNTRNDVKDGYGKGITEMITKNFFNQGDKTIYHTTI